MHSEQTLKRQLEVWALGPEETPSAGQRWEAAQAMLDFIGSTDSQLRDELIYATFARWIYVERRFGPRQLHHLFEVAQDDRHLLHGLGEEGTDTVFTRSFSMLLLALLLDADRKESFLTKPEVEQTLERVLDYLSREQDRRGYVKGKGWAHSVAHAADTLDELAQHRALDKAHLDKIIEMISASVMVSDPVYQYGEAERLVTVLMSICRRGLISDADWADWVRSFVPPIESLPHGPEWLRVRTNVNNLLQTFYFQLLWKQYSRVVQEVISGALREISR